MTGTLQRRRAPLRVVSFGLFLLLALASTPQSAFAAAPVITVQPVGSTNLTATEVTFRVVATGTAPLTYQWYFNVTNGLLGQTQSTLTYTNIAAFQQGYFSVVVANASGSVTSAPAYLEVLIPPLVTREPTNVTVAVGGTATFSVDAVGDEPLRFQWFFNIIDEIIGATNSSLTLTNLRKSDSGLYQIEVSNDYDTVNSIEALLTVKDPPRFVSQPANVTVPAGNPAGFSVEVSGDGPFSFQWYFDQTNAIFGATDATLSIPNPQLLNAGTYHVRVSTDVGSITSAPVSLVVLKAPAISIQPVSTTTIVNSNASFSVTATGTPPLLYQWYFNRTIPIAGATEGTLDLSHVQLSDAGLYSVAISNQSGSVTSINASLTVLVPPQLTVQPNSQTLRAGQTAQFIASATGTAPLFYRWFFNGTNLIAGANNSSYALPNAQLANAGLYSVTVSNLAGLAVSAPATLTVQSPPVILQPPLSRSVLPGTTVTYSVNAAGDAPLSYQWYLNSSTPIAGATGPQFTIDNAQKADSGRYSVRITNSLGFTVSTEATLAVMLPPTIVQQPASLTVTQGNTPAFTVSVSGDGPFTYRWLNNGATIEPGTNGPVLKLPDVQSADAGIYSVTVSNDVGSITSEGAQLIVRTPPSIVTQPADVFVAPGGTANFSVVAVGDLPRVYRWLFNGTNSVASATNSTLSVPGVTAAADGLYSVVVVNPYGTTISSNAALHVRQLPVVTTSPVSLTVTQGNAAVFSVTAGGDGPFAYQWFFNSIAIAGATGPTYALGHAQPGDEGLYAVRITNVVGAALSSPATLTVRRLPVLTQQPSSLTSTQGQTVSFTVTAASETPLTYQWQRNGINLLEHSPTLQITSVRPSNRGSYGVIVANSYGTVTSLVATLTVYGFDFGDAPEPSYATLRSSDGARHVLVAGVHLGAGIDEDDDGQPSVNATGDDASGVSDEDGIRFSTPFHLGQPVRVDVIASTNGFLNAWIDFDGAGGFHPANEQVFTNVALQPGTNALTLNIPKAAVAGNSFARFRFSSASNLSPIGLAPDGEVEDYGISIEPSIDLVTLQSYSAASVSTGSPGLLRIVGTNHGPSSASGVVVTHHLSPRSIFVSANASLGSCTLQDGAVICPIGTLAPGSGFAIDVATTVGQGTNLSTTVIQVNEFDPSPSHGSATSVIVGTGLSAQYANSDVVIMPLPDAGAATPYPSDIVVAGLTGAVHQVKVTLRGLNHDYPGDIDILLLGPQGQSSILMSDAGFDSPVLDATVTFDEIAGGPLPDSGAITTGAYIPYDYPPLNDSFPSPAPTGPHTADLAVFRGTDPNGTWSLFVVDDSFDNGLSDVPGFIADGWTLNFVTADPLADLGVTSVTAPATASIGETTTYSVTATNNGPTGSSATCRSSLPSSLVFVSATSSQGACTHDANIVTCDLGNIAPGGSAQINVSVAAVIGGNVSTTFSISGSQLDVNPSNDSTIVTHFVRPIADLSLATFPPPAPVLLNQRVSSTTLITNRGPNTATGVWLTNALPANAIFDSFTASQGSCSAVGQTVLCDLGSVPAGSSSTVVIRFIPGSTDLNSNSFRVVAVEADSDPGNNLAGSVFSVVPATDLSLTAQFPGTTLPLGKDYTLILDITNRGPRTTSATVSYTLPPANTYVSAFTSRGACTNSGRQVSCAFDDLIQSESARVVVHARPEVLGAITNVAVVTGTLPDFNTDNNSITASSIVIPNADLAVAIANRPDPVWRGDNLVSSVTVTNQGPSAASGVLLTNLIPAGATFVSASTSQGACVRAGDVVRCDIGALPAHAAVSVNLVTRPAQAGLATCTSIATSAVVDSDPANNTVRLSTQVIAGNLDLANSAAVTAPLLGLASPYPSTITVTGATSAIYRVRVVLANLSHTYPDDLDMLLVGPNGRSTLLMSDCGGEFSINNSTLTFDDGAASALSDSGLITSGTFKPTNYGTDIDLFAAPAPIGPYVTDLSTFNGTDPNGTWSLYVMDDSDKDSGTIAGGWRLVISAFEPMADLGITQAVSRSVAATGSNIVFSYTVTNRGPSAASAVRITSRLPDTLNITGFTNSLGSCAVLDGNLNCTLGTISPFGAAALSVAATSLVPGTLSNVAIVSFAGVDLQPSNNVSTTLVTFELPPTITLQPVTQTATLGSSVQFIATAVGAAPLSYQWQKDGTDVPGATSATLSLLNITFSNAGTYRLRVSNGFSATLSDAAQLLIPGPPTISSVADRSIDEDTDAGPIPFVIQDFDTAPSTLALSAESSNSTVVPGSGFIFGGSGQNRTVRITPAPNQSGATVIKLVVRDTTGASATNSFTLTVRPVIDPILILEQPRHVLALTGAPVTLFISATSSLPITYQWQRDTLSLAGATASNLVFPAVNGTNAGSYRVLLSNGETNVTSVTVTLSLTNQLPRPSIVSIGQAGTTATVTFQTVSGLRYTLEYKRTISDATWTPLGTTSGTGENKTLTDAAATIPSRFYRIRAE